jgi:hypothetical protein
MGGSESGEAGDDDGDQSDGEENWNGSLPSSPRPFRRSEVRWRRPPLDWFPVSLYVPVEYDVRPGLAVPATKATMIEPVRHY